jgi:uncharacterized protein YkwD
MSCRPLVTALFAVLLTGCVEQSVAIPDATASAARAGATNGGCTAPAQAARLLPLVNLERRKAGLAAVALSDRASAAAQAFACEIAARRDISHTGNDGSNVADRLARVGIAVSFVAENSADGYTTPEQAIAAWMESPGHRRNILSAEVTMMGVGQAAGAYPTWVLDLYAPG